MQKCRSTYYF